MKRKLLGALLLIILVMTPIMVYLSVTQEEYPVQATQVVKTPTVDELLTLVNAERAKAGVEPLVLDQRLNASAQAKADDMQTDGYYDHVDPVTGEQGYIYIREQAIAGCRGAENLNNGASNHTGTNTVNAWLNSPAHKEIMLGSDYTITGFGISRDYIVEHFCNMQ